MNRIETAVALAIGLCGCSGADGVPLDEAGPVTASPRQDESGTEEIAQPIFQGIPGGSAGVVGLVFRDKTCTETVCPLSMCTGAIVGRHVVMTAGHCVARAGWNALSGSVFGGQGAVTYLDPRTNTFKCLTRASGSIDGACNSSMASEFAPMNGLVDPAYVDDLPANTRRDMALLYIPRDWPSPIDKTDSIRIAFGSTRRGVNGTAVRKGDTFWAIGNGENGSGPGTEGIRASIQTRYGWMQLARASSPVSLSRCALARGTRAHRRCSLSLVISSLSLGVFSNVGKKSFDDFCAEEGTVQKRALTETEISFINQTMTLLNVPCKTVGYIVTSTLGYSVRECW